MPRVNLDMELILMNTLSSVFTNFDENYLNYLTQVCSKIKPSDYKLAGIHDNKGKKYDILDVGCGLGFDTINFSKILSKDSRIVGIDKDNYFIEKAKERAEEQGLNNLEYYCMNASNISFSKEFDSVYVSNLFQELNFPELVFRKILASTKQNGIVTIVDIDWSTFNCRFLSSLDNQLISSMYTQQIFWQVDLNKLEYLFKKYRLTDIKTETIRIELNYNDYLKISKITETMNNLPDIKSIIRVKEILRLKLEKGIFGDINIIIISGKVPN